ncbi:MAG: nucleotidyltransferase family protein, partial [Pseudomonadota bacterium]|nr:nucleotidyltransferase family protein [Pseudomonadota bacterium]
EEGAGAKPAAPAPAPRSRALDLAAFASRCPVVWPVLDPLARALPPAAAALLIRPALAARAAEAEALSAEFRRLAALLDAAGVEAVAIKAAAAIAETGGAPALWREMVDFDLLVAPDDLPRAVEALIAAGYRGDVDAYVSTDYHFPALFPPPGGMRTVELHTRLGWSRRGLLSRLARRTAPSPLAGIRLPSADDRLAHLVHHAQAGDRRFAQRTARLRDALDWRVLIDRRGADAAAAAAAFEADGAGPAFHAFAALMERVWGRREAGLSAPSPAAEAWAAAALDAIADPALAARRREDDRRAALVSAVTTRETLHHLVAGTLNPDRLRRFLRRLHGHAD